MRRLTLGILAHVDAGKTTLSEALLVASGALRAPGRVDYALPFWTPTPRRNAAGSPFFQSRPILNTAISR